MKKILIVILSIGALVMAENSLDKEVIISSPLSGKWTIYNPPGHAPLAFDLLAVDAKESLYKESSFFWHIFSFIDVSKTHTWEQQVYSPVNGEVVSILNNVKDRESINFVYDLVSLGIYKPDEKEGFGAFGGNHIVIKSDDFYVLLCHLKQASVTVSKGDKVKVGDKIAQIGNSGSSIQPHLHLQVMKDENIFPLFKNLIPFKIEKAEVRSDGEWIKKEDFSLVDREYYKFYSY